MFSEIEARIPRIGQGQAEKELAQAGRVVGHLVVALVLLARPEEAAQPVTAPRGPRARGDAARPG